jgi:RNA polymerase sigma-70 factor (ECF subfamily)
MRLFALPGRIQLRMSTATSCAIRNPLPSATAAIAGLLCNTSFAAQGPLLFSTLMADETKTIAAGLRRRDPDLLDRLIEQYQYRLFRYLTYVTGNRERAEDFFQETWIRVLERGHQYDGKSKFEAWLFSIARHLVIDWQRAKKPQSLDALTNPDEGAPLEFADDDPSPLHMVLTQESDSTVRASVEKLPAIYREVLLLRFQEELQLTEIAAVLAAPISTVKSRLYRGLEELRVLLTGAAA